MKEQKNNLFLFLDNISKLDDDFDEDGFLNNSKFFKFDQDTIIDSFLILKDLFFKTDQYFLEFSNLKDEFDFNTLNSWDNLSFIIKNI
jgi:hypothetical protein